MNRLKDVRIALRLTQAEVAKKLHIAQNTYSYWENGSVNISNESFVQLAELFNVSIDFLSGRKYRLGIPFDKWQDDYKEDWQNANPHTRALTTRRSTRTVCAHNRCNHSLS